LTPSVGCSPARVLCVAAGIVAAGEVCARARGSGQTAGSAVDRRRGGVDVTWTIRDISHLRVFFVLEML
jgi:hypothetical protein